MDLIGLRWRKSSRSGGNGGDCVEVAASRTGAGAATAIVAVRDSKDPSGPKLLVTPTAWRALTDGIKRGRLDL
jgi:hypothetical protein